jgi:hypothetical protein
MSDTASFNYDPYDQNIVVIGSAGSGKTHFVKWLIMKFLLPANVDFVVWDYNHRGYTSYTDFKLPVPTLHKFDPKVRQFVFQPFDKSEKAFVQFSKQAFTANKVIIIEETQEYARKMFMPDEFENLVRTGRNYGVTYIAITQRPQEIHTAILSNADHLFVFKLTYPPDVELLVKWVGQELRNLTSLPRYYFYYRNKYADRPYIMQPVVM